jgi:hypothetical protein
MKTRIRSAIQSLAFAGGVVDSLAIFIVLFAVAVNVDGLHPLLSRCSLLLAMGLFVVLAVMATLDRN